MICPACGADVVDGVRFCEACGTALNLTNNSENTILNNPTETETESIINEERELENYTEEQVAGEVPIIVADASEKDSQEKIQDTILSPIFQIREQEKPFGIWRWIGVILLLQIPIVQVVMTIVWACSAKRQTLKNFARAIIICFLVGIILSVSAAIVMRAININFIQMILPFFPGRSW